MSTAYNRKNEHGSVSKMPYDGGGPPAARIAKPKGTHRLTPAPTAASAAAHRGARRRRAKVARRRRRQERARAG